jgi:hypothetical protein
MMLLKHQVIFLESYHVSKIKPDFWSGFFICKQDHFVSSLEILTNFAEMILKFGLYNLDEKGFIF